MVAEVVHQHHCTFACKRFGNRCANASAGACDQDHLAGKVACGGVHFLVGFVTVGSSGPEFSKVIAEELAMNKRLATRVDFTQ